MKPPKRACCRIRRQLCTLRNQFIKLLVTDADLLGEHRHKYPFAVEHLTALIASLAGHSAERAEVFAEMLHARREVRCRV